MTPDNVDPAAGSLPLAAAELRFTAGICRLLAGNRAATFADLTELLPLAERVGRLAAAEHGPSPSATETGA